MISSSCSRPHRSCRYCRFTGRWGVILVAVNVAACTTWQPASAPLRQVAEEEALSTIRVTLADDSEIQVRNPAIVGDSLYARERGAMPVGMAAVEDVRRVQVKETEPLGTALLVTGVVVGLLAALLNQACQAGDGGMVC